MAGSCISQQNIEIKSPEDLKEQYREWVLSALEEDKNEMETKEC